MARKFRVYVSLKPTVLDPEGETIRRALLTLGYNNIASVRQGRFFDIVVTENGDPEAIRAEIEKIADEVLSNPVIQEFRIEPLESD